MSASRQAHRQRMPGWALAVAVIGAAFFTIPLAGLLWRVPWTRWWELVTARPARDALWLSLLCASSAAAVSLVFGIPLAWLLARHQFPGRAALRALCVLSMVLPPVVAGVALLSAFGRRGMIGESLDRWFGVQLPFTTAGAVLAQTFVAMPFLVVTVEAALRQTDVRFDDAARAMGATPWYSFRRVVLPSIRPAIVAGTVLAWARALGEFGATITFAGNLPGSTQTLPLSVYLALETDPDQAAALSFVLVAISFTVLVALRDRWLGGLTRVAPRTGAE